MVSGQALILVHQVDWGARVAKSVVWFGVIDCEEAYWATGGLARANGFVREGALAASDLVSSRRVLCAFFVRFENLHSQFPFHSPVSSLLLLQNLLGPEQHVGRLQEFVS